MLWQLIADFYERQGVTAWTEVGVPMRVSANPVIAKAYAQTIVAYLRDIAAQETHGPAGAPVVTVIELGAGHGYFGFLAARALSAAIAERPGIPTSGFRYLMTDAARSNVVGWIEDPRIGALIDDDIMDVAVLDVADPAAAQSEVSGKPLAEVIAAGPVVVIAITTIVVPRVFSACIAPISASSPSESRLALGSSSTSNAGLPKTARANPSRWRWPADSITPPSPISVS